MSESTSAVFMLDHMITQMAFANRSQINQHSAAGMMMTMLSNRVSHTFNFCGPSLSIDTACSSSLVSFHVACQDIWRGACDMAVTGGVNVMMRPEYPMGMCKGHFLSRDGESKSFDSRGDGYGRGEGAGAVLLKPLSKAIEDGDHVLATVVGSGTNQDGRTPGISMPNGEAQQALIEQVCRDYGVNPQQVDYVECHGTGTAIGDPTECRAIGNTYGKGRGSDNPIVIGSIKSNIGHLEAAAGVAGVDQGCPDDHEPSLNAAWKSSGKKRRDSLQRFEHPSVRSKSSNWEKRISQFAFAINSFGYGGSNAHVLMQSPDTALPVDSEGVIPTPSGNGHSNGHSNGHANGHANGKPKSRSRSFPLVLPVTAKSKESLEANAASIARVLRDSDTPLEDVVYTVVRRRALLNHRAVAMGNNREELIAALEAVASDSEHQNLVRDTQPFQGLERPVFVFTGMGPQWWYMGQQLYKTEPLYKKVVDEADAIFRKIAGFSILDEMLKSEEDSEVQKTVYAQPANFIIQLGVFELLKAAGIRPGLVVGHSVGELGFGVRGRRLESRRCVKGQFPSFSAAGGDRRHGWNAGSGRWQRRSRANYRAIQRRCFPGGEQQSFDRHAGWRYSGSRADCGTIDARRDI